MPNLWTIKKKKKIPQNLEQQIKVYLKAKEVVGEVSVINDG